MVYYSISFIFKCNAGMIDNLITSKVTPHAHTRTHTRLQACGYTKYWGCLLYRYASDSAESITCYDFITAWLRYATPQGRRPFHRLLPL